MIEARPGLIDYWHDRYMHELTVRHQILAALKLPVSMDERLAEIDRLANWRLPGG